MTDPKLEAALAWGSAYPPADYVGRIAQLEAENAALVDDIHAWQIRHDKLFDEAEKIRIERDALRADLAAARAVLDRAEALGLTTPDLKRVLYVNADAWQAWREGQRDAHEQQAAKHGYVDEPASDPVHDTWEEHRGER